MKNFMFLLGAVIIFGSCSTGDAATALMLGRSSQAPVFLDCRPVSENEIEFVFSKPVEVTYLSLNPVNEIASIKGGSTVSVTLEKKIEPGILVTADLLAEDADKNTINVLVPFRARNNRMPELVINEVRTEYSNPRAEFIEFKMKSAGNLGAMRIFLAGGGTQKPTIYEFAPVEVLKGEYVVLHLRRLEEDCRDEYGTNLSESGGTQSLPTARDFWVPGTSKLINTTGVVYILDQDDRVLDAVMFSDNKNSQWPKDYLQEAAEFLYSRGAWKSVNGNICGSADALNSANTTLTRTICRDETKENTGTASDWYVTVTSGATPGKPNNPGRYVP